MEHWNIPVDPGPSQENWNIGSPYRDGSVQTVYNSETPVTLSFTPKTSIYSKIFPNTQMSLQAR